MIDTEWKFSIDITRLSDGAHCDIHLKFVADGRPVLLLISLAFRTPWHSEPMSGITEVYIASVDPENTGSYCIVLLASLWLAR